MIPNNTIDVVESLIWNTLIPSCPKLADDIDDSNDKNEEDNDNDDEHDDLSPVRVGK